MEDPSGLKIQLSSNNSLVKRSSLVITQIRNGGCCQRTTKKMKRKTLTENILIIESIE